MSHFYIYPKCAIETNLFVQFANKTATEFAEKELSSFATTLLCYFSSSQEFIQTLGEEVAKKVAVRELHRGVGSTDYVHIEMLFIQEEQDEDDDANAPSALSVSFLSQKCQFQLHLTLTPASTQAQPQTRAYLGHRLQVGPHRSSKCGHCRRMSSWVENRCCNSRNCASLSARFRKQYLDRDYLQLYKKISAAISNDRHNNRKKIKSLCSAAEWQIW